MCPELRSLHCNAESGLRALPAEVEGDRGCQGAPGAGAKELREQAGGALVGAAPVPRSARPRLRNIALRLRDAGDAKQPKKPGGYSRQQPTCSAEGLLIPRKSLKMGKTTGQMDGLLKTQCVLEVKNGQETGADTVIAVGVVQPAVSSFSVIHQIRAPEIRFGGCKKMPPQ
ncbi:uncharacterized protein RBU33_029079 isoform 1-T1 [Hipposideros larvatus]